MSSVFLNPELPAADTLACRGVTFGHEIVAELYEQPLNITLLSYSIEALRVRVALLRASSSERDQRVVKSINANFQKSEQDSFRKGSGVQQQLGEAAVLDWLTNASDRDIVAFAEWNTERQYDMGVALQQDREALIGSSLERVEELVALGFYPSRAIDALYHTSKDLPPFRPIDSFEAGALQLIGSFNGEQIALSNLYTDRGAQTGINRELEALVFHELLHATGCMRGGGFLFGNAKKIYGRYWEEAFVSHSTSVAFRTTDDPQIEVFDTRGRHDKDLSSYSEERRILETLSRERMANIPAALWANAFFSEAGTPSHIEPAIRLHQIFHSMGYNSRFSAFNDDYERTWSPHDEQGRKKLLESLNEHVARIAVKRGDVFTEDIAPEQGGVYRVVAADIS